MYSVASEQQINFNKSALSFSANVSDQMRGFLKQILGVTVCSLHNKYLGLPTTIGPSKMQPFKMLRKRVWRKLQGWKEKLLSKVGREVLIKAVAQAIPTYVMSYFKIPVALCNDINRMVSNFWWGQKDTERRLHWLKWDNLCLPKRDGGVGFRHMEAFNLALLAKQGWRLLHYPDSIFFKIYKAKYFLNGSFLDARLGHNPSFTWRSILTARPIIEVGSRWRIGSGTSVAIWGQRWLPKPSTFKVISPPVDGLHDLMVADLIDQDSMSWKEDRVRDLFIPFEAEEICAIPLSVHASSDKLIWHYSKNGVYSVKSGYHIAVHLSSSFNAANKGEGSSMDLVNKAWKLLWSLCLPNKIKNLIWRSSLNILLVGSRLVDRHVSTDPLCRLCGESPETPMHFFLYFPWAQIVWDTAEGLFPAALPHLDFR
uniref:Reverse transcriptase zinc-binding domain-containing protein n=1 Tax=Davidia involucrata TaxID=16924 RepID=A0A5B7BF13_DAVIN